ncbi:D-isomer specific 2-hydroxyacid dehydrogenase [Gongronella butleri]|nr:D-isomer specific 2-hydroxyacid dehydrogenase [Gongronella butleri]
MTRCLIVGNILFATDILAELRKSLVIDYCTSKSREEFMQDCQGNYKDYDVFYVSSEVFATFGRFDAQIVAQFPPKLRFLCFCAAGYDAIDVVACAERNILVSNTPGAVDDPTGDVGALLILNCCRNAYQAADNLRKGRFRHGVRMGITPQGKKLGILGMGGIGKTIAKRMAAFDMEIIYYNRNRMSVEGDIDPPFFFVEEQKYGATYVDFETLLATSDVISVSVPLNKNTTHLLSYREFSMMKQGVIIVNTARGKVINEAALVQALESGKVASAGLDVFEEEPVVHPGLLAHPQSVLLPHIGTFTNESQKNMEELTLENVTLAMRNARLVTVIPEHRHLQSKDA